MSRTELLVIWMVLAAVGSALQSERNSSSRSNVFPKTFGGSRYPKISPSQRRGPAPVPVPVPVPASRRGLNGSHSQANEVPGVWVSESVRRYLTGPSTTVVIPFLYTLVFAASLPLNLLAILLFLFKVVTANNTAVMYMTNLAVADLLFVLLLPLKISYNFSGNDWRLGWFLCRLVTGGFYAYMCSSVLLMTCISVDRCLAVVYPIRWTIWRSRRRSACLCLASWLLSICGTLPFFLTEQTVYIADLNITTCHDVQSFDALHIFSLYCLPYLLVVFFLVLLVVNTVCNAKIISKLHSASAVNPQGKRHAIVLAIIVLCVFIVCFTPTNIILVLHALNLIHENGESYYFAYVLCLCLCSVSCCLDPLIYYYASSSFQNQLHHLLRSGQNKMIQVKERINKVGTSTPHQHNQQNGVEAIMLNTS
ncbi:proteinase-activated receptor 1-like [Rhinoraja longicauda]